MTTWQHDNMTTWQHDNMTTWQHDNMTTCQHDNMTTWQHDNMTTWQHDNMTAWQHDNMTSAKHSITWESPWGLLTTRAVHFGSTFGALWITLDPLLNMLSTFRSILRPLGIPRAPRLRIRWDLRPILDQKPCPKLIHFQGRFPICTDFACVWEGLFFGWLLGAPLDEPM